MPTSCCSTGKSTYPGGHTYEGDFKDNQRCGWGTFTTVEGDVYEGEWDKDVVHGGSPLVAVLYCWYICTSVHLYCCTAGNLCIHT